MLHFNSTPVKVAFQTSENAGKGELSRVQTPLSLHRCKTQRTFAQKPYLVVCQYGTTQPQQIQTTDVTFMRSLKPDD